MNKWIELLFGLILLIGAILVAYWSSVNAWAVAGKSLNFASAAWTVFKGGLFWFVVGIGALFIMLGISDLKG